MTIRLDLRNLTKEMVEEACSLRVRASQENLDACLYSNPCIIGSLMSPEDREVAENSFWDGDDLYACYDEGVIYFPDDQIDDAAHLQGLFDLGETDALMREAFRWITESAEG